MKLRTGIDWRWLVCAVLGLALLAMACGTDDAGDTAAEGEDTIEASRYIGLEIDDATALAEEEGRLWRIARDGEEHFGMDASLVVGRVTFEVDDGTVTVASIESETGPPDTEPDDVDDDPTLAQLQSDAIVRLVTVDNSFGSDTLPFDTVIVSTAVSNGSRPVQALALELVAAGIEADATVKFTDDPDTEIADFAASEATAVAVVEIEDLRVDGERAEIDLSLWCGTTCAVFLTYEAELAGQQWTITGTSGPIAVA